MKTVRITDQPHSQSFDHASGQALIEYVILLALGALAAVLGLTILGADIRDVFKKIRFDDELAVVDEQFKITVVDQSQQGIANLRVYAFSNDGSYLDIYKTTNDNGVATFKLDKGSYQFLARYQDQGYWSDHVNWPQQKQTTLQIDSKAFLVNVVDLAGNSMPDLPVYAFSSEGTYLNLSATTDPSGATAFLLASGEFMFRADHNGRENWSKAVSSEEGSVTITVNSCPTNQFMAEYYNGRSFSGEPVLIRCEDQINNFWSRGTPAAGVNKDLFSIRWSGEFEFSEAAYSFAATGDDGIKVFVDGKQIINGWRNQPATTYANRVDLSEGLHDIRMDYYENYGYATAVLAWQETVTSCPKGQFLTEYFNNRNLSGNPVLSQCENAINLSIGTNSPAQGVNRDNFSIRWSGTFDFDAGTYTFVTTIDDGGRVYVDGDRIINSWRDQSNHTYTGAKALTAGEHEVQMEYYEAGGHSTAKLSWSR